MKLVKLQSLVAKCCKMWKIYPCKVCEFCIMYVLGAQIVTFLGSISARDIIIYKTCKLCKAIPLMQTLPHFAIKFCNFTNFIMFLTVISFPSPRYKINLLCKLSIGNHLSFKSLRVNHYDFMALH